MNDKEMFYIFLNVDGVLNATSEMTQLRHLQIKPTVERTPNGYIGAEQQYIAVLSALVSHFEWEHYDVSIILSSDWKDGLEKWQTRDGIKVFYDGCDKDVQYLIDNLAEEDLDTYLVDKTPDIPEKGHRGDEIIAWLNQHGMDETYEHYIILDDDVFDFPSHEELRKHVIMTDTIVNAQPLVYTDGDKVLPLVAKALSVIENAKEQAKGNTENECERE